MTDTTMTVVTVMTVITMPKDTSIGVNEPTWKRLNARKGPGDDFEAVINDALDELERLQEIVESVGPEGDVDEPTSVEDRVEQIEAEPTSDFDPDLDAGELLQEASVGPIEAALEGWPGENAKKVQQRRESASAMLQWLRDDGGRHSAKEIREALLPEHGVEGQSERTWWRKTGRPALQQARDAGVVEYREDFSDYSWSG